VRVPVNAQLRGGASIGNEYFILATWLSLSWFNCRNGITMAGLKTTPKTLKKRKWTYLAEMKTLIRKLIANSTVPTKKPALTAKIGK